MRYARFLARGHEDAAEDLVQDALCLALAKQHLFSPESDLRAWLFTILHNQHVNRVRRAVRRGVGVEVEIDGPTARSIAGPEAADAAHEFREAMKALLKLPSEMGEVLTLAMEGRCYEEIAEVTHAPLGTVRSRLSRGREALRRSLEGTIGAPALLAPEPELPPPPPRPPTVEEKIAGALLAHLGKTVTTTALTAAVWPHRGASYKGLLVHISRLRPKLLARGYRLVTVRGVGYRLERRP